MSEFPSTPEINPEVNSETTPEIHPENTPEGTPEGTPETTPVTPPEPPSEPAPAPTPAAPIIRDTTTVRHFRTGSVEGFLPRLNQDLDLELTPEVFQRLQSHFKSTAFRDPTVGELRLLNTLAKPGVPTPDRIAVGELTTSSPAIAETWADMMAKHGALHGAFGMFRNEKAPSPPCTLTDALTLTGRYLRRAENRRDDHLLFLASPRREAVATAEGYAPVARIAIGEGVLSLWKRHTPALRETPCRAGDVILYLPRLKLRQVQALLEEDAKRSHPAVGLIRAVAEESLLSTLAGLCPAADLYVSRLTRGKSDPTRIPVEQICARPVIPSDGTCGYLVRVPVKQAQAMNQLLDAMKIPSVVCGQVRNGGNLVFFVRDEGDKRDLPAATLPVELLGSFEKTHLYAMHVEAASASVPEAVSPAMTRLPSVIPSESGVTPDGRETVALTLCDDEVLRLPHENLLMAARSVEIPDPHTAYSASAEAVASLARLLEARGMTRENIRLTVSLRASGASLLTGGGALGAICGIYCAAAQLALPVEEPTVDVTPSEIPLRLTVTALATDKPKAREKAARTDSVSSPAYLLPVLRRSYEDSLKALAAALNSTCGAPCIIRPLAMNAGLDEATGEPVYTLHPDSQSKLTEQLAGEHAREILPIFSMNEGDTRILLSQPGVAEALHRRLEMGGHILVLGDSCKAFAELGLLPSALLETTTIPAVGQTAAVTYSFPAESSTRLFRVAPLAPSDTSTAADTPHLLKITLPDGIVIPDGFIGGDGQVLGLLNGVDTPIIPYLRGEKIHD